MNKQNPLIKKIKQFVKSFFRKHNIEFYGRAKKKRILEAISLTKQFDLGHPLIRVGGEGDGGYLLPDILDGIKYCFSPGVGLISEFESQLKNREIKSFLADFTVDEPAAEDLFKFEKKFIKSYNSENSITFDDWIKNSVNPTDKDFLVQMDIEGSEYEVINSISNFNLEKIKIMVIEFHHLQFLTNEVFLENYISVFRKLKNYFEINHIHPNNCCGVTTVDDLVIPNVLEVTFLNKKYVQRKNQIIDLPNSLDKKNVEKKKDIKLSYHWF